jgi:hypothetical protein
VHAPSKKKKKQKNAPTALEKMVVSMGDARCSRRLSSGLAPVTWACITKPTKASMARRPFLSSCEEKGERVIKKM